MAYCEECVHNKDCENYEPKSTMACEYYKDKSQMKTYVYVGNIGVIKLAEQITKGDKGIVHMGEFESLEKAKEYDKHCCEDKLGYSELREQIHRILSDFFNYELSVYKTGEFDFEYMEFRTDEILRLIKRQGGTY